MEKYGFVYIWFDRKHKRYYIGCHWGTVDDGYICSSSNMKSAHTRRPKDFKRKIISFVRSNKKDLLEEEYKWISKIKKEELGKRYYNLHNHHFSHWSANETQLKTLSERISQKTKEAMYRPDVREKYLAGLAKRDNGSSRPEVREKRRQSMIGKNVGKDNSKAVKSSAEMRRGVPLTEEHRNKIKETTAFKSLNNMKIKCAHCDFIGNKGNVARYHNDRCKHKSA
jgi:hypothetical protein